MSARSDDAKRRPLAPTLLQGIEAMACALLLAYGFRVAGKPGAIWALVSAVVILRPGFEDSLRASQARVAANLLGAVMGVAVGSSLGTRPVPIAIALFLVVLLCRWEPLLPAVRSACVGVVIVMMHEGPLRQSGYERLIAVTIGCAVALAISYMGDRLYRQIASRHR
jgi:uncharacterized membrane protein YgaE (UPF0421/DUF939 family)